MSYSTAVEIPKNSEPDAIDAMLCAAPVIGNEDAAAERDAAVDAARIHVAELLEEGVLGDSFEHSFRVTINGHANRDNEAADTGRVYVNIMVARTD